MTDREYIDEIKKGNDKMLTILYDNYRGRFFNYFTKNFDISRADVADIYQDSWTGVWSNIQNGRLTGENLNVKLETYLFQVGKYISLARNRKEKTMPKADVKVLYRIQTEGEDIDLDNNHVFAIKRDECALMAVRNVGEPCTTILTRFYIEKKSGEQIAVELGYKDATSIKTQKYKCMQKVKSLLDTQLEKLNLR